MTVRECYEKLGGDYDDAMSRVGSEKFISKYLLKFLDLTDFNDMIEAISIKDWDAAFRASHNLKGIALNLSFTKLAGDGASLCDTMRHGAPVIDITELKDKVSADYKLAVDAITQFKNEM